MTRNVKSADVPAHGRYRLVRGVTRCTLNTNTGAVAKKYVSYSDSCQDSHVSKGCEQYKIDVRLEVEQGTIVESCVFVYCQK